MLASLSIFVGLIIIALIFSQTDIVWIFIAITFLGLFDLIYILISAMYFVKSSNYKFINKSKDKVVNINKDNNQNTNINNNNKEQKKFIFKTYDDKLYEEAVKYFGKSYVKNRSKAEVIEEYLKEDKF